MRPPISDLLSRYHPSRMARGRNEEDDVLVPSTSNSTIKDDNGYCPAPPFPKVALQILGHLGLGALGVFVVVWLLYVFLR